ncbi:YdbL family protein [Asticcacaulis sp. EMRT-3]|uniref:YdbL family protein n=1 Tax=Asticcacaulis sp. EMRT-3 TaxID=3040349 RepID=UPI0024AED6F9|nr:YdbL family protein [Asticcacaulis sp. EMRT-3]MDI7776225.1 YdbL family protein [Asticcacaulis sp. EMRT-3]
MKSHSFLKAAAIAVSLSGAAVGAICLTTAPAYADIATAKALVDAAKATGTVGEMSTGYLGFVKDSGSNALKVAVDEINAGRKQVYAEAAAKNGVSAQAAAISAYTNVIVPRLKSGEFYQNAAGNWVQK